MDVLEAYTGEDDWWMYPATVEAVARWWATQSDCTLQDLISFLFGDPRDFTGVYRRWLES